MNILLLKKISWKEVFVDQKGCNFMSTQLKTMKKISWERSIFMMAQLSKKTGAYIHEHSKFQERGFFFHEHLVITQERKGLFSWRPNYTRREGPIFMSTQISKKGRFYFHEHSIIQVRGQKGGAFFMSTYLINQDGKGVNIFINTWLPKKGLILHIYFHNHLILKALISGTG